MLEIVPDLNIFVFSITIFDLLSRSALARFILLRARYLFNSMGLRFYIFCLEPALRLCDRHCHGWAHSIDTTKVRFEGLCDIILFVFNTVIIANLFVCGQHLVFVISIVTCECDLFILRKLWLRVCHHYFCLFIYNESVI